jgi:hypothetical protein
VEVSSSRSHTSAFRVRVLLLTILSLDNTGGDTFSQQQGGNEYGTSTLGGAGQTGGRTGLSGTDTSGQYGDTERFTTGQTGQTGQTGSYTDPSARTGAGGGRQREDDDDYGASIGPGGGPTGKPSMTTRMKGLSLSNDVL